MHRLPLDASSFALLRQTIVAVRSSCDVLSGEKPSKQAVPREAPRVASVLPSFPVVRLPHSASIPSVAYSFVGASFLNSRVGPCAGGNLQSDQDISLHRGLTGAPAVSLGLAHTVNDR